MCFMPFFYVYSPLAKKKIVKSKREREREERKERKLVLGVFLFPLPLNSIVKFAPKILLIHYIMIRSPFVESHTLIGIH